MLVCEIPTITMNFRRTGVWAHLPNLPPSNRQRSLRTKTRPTKVQERCRFKWRMVRRTSIQIKPVQYWSQFSTQWTTNLNKSVLMTWSSCWMSIRFANQQMAVFLATSIQFQTCLTRSVWSSRFGVCGSSWGDGCGMLISQENKWRMKWVLQRLSPRLQRQCTTNLWLRLS